MLKIYKYPDKAEWKELVRRPVKDVAELTGTVKEILNDVRCRGDEAVRDYELKFDKVKLKELIVSDEEKEEAEQLVSPELREAISLAHENISTFHSLQAFHGEHCKVAEGIECWQKSIAIENVGLYVPGGTAPLFSTVLMLATPARIAGCKEIILCTPPTKEGKINPAVLTAAKIAGVSRIYKAGGVQAIAAMAYGTESIPKVYKILGPGNQYVTCAKQLVSAAGTAIDMPAGPSEVMVLADETSNPSFVASDLLSQAEHGKDTQAILLTTTPDIVLDIADETERQLENLPRKEIAECALKNSRIIILHDKEEMMEFANMYAPEHLIIETADYMELSKRVVNAGSVFLGSFTPESAGDYASGTNHTLPTNGYAAAYSGVNLDTFCRKVTFQHISPKGIKAIGKAVEIMAEAETLEAHKRAMRLRRKAVEKDNL